MITLKGKRGVKIAIPSKHHQLYVNITYFDASLEDTTLNNKCRPKESLFVKARIKIPTPIPNVEFIVVQFKENSTKMENIEANLLESVEKELVKFLKANTDLFSIYPYEMPDIYLNVSYHQLNIDPSRKNYFGIEIH